MFHNPPTTISSDRLPFRSSLYSVSRVKYDSHGYHLEDGFVDRGSSGIVAKVAHENDSNSFFARKQIPKWRINEGDLRNEVRLIRDAEHLHVIKIVEDYEDDENFYIVMAPFATGTLSKELQRMSNGSQTLEDFGEKRLQLFRFIRCLAATIRELHSRGIRHRDIKPDNILIEDQTVIVTDFGTSFESREVTQVGLTKHGEQKSMNRQKHLTNRKAAFRKRLRTGQVDWEIYSCWVAFSMKFLKRCLYKRISLTLMIITQPMSSTRHSSITSARLKRIVFWFLGD
jgi:serine/threonine protein kinase